MRKDEMLGVLLMTIVIGSGLVGYITFEDARVKYRIDEDKTTIYLKNIINRYQTAGREFNSLWDFPTKMNRDLSETYYNYTVDNSTNVSWHYRYTKYQRGPLIKDTYIFDGKITNIEDQPGDHMIEIFNGTGFVYQYEIRDLKNVPETKHVMSPVQYGKIKIEWDPGYYYAKQFKSGVVKVRYKIESDYVVIHARMTDPTEINFSVNNGTSISADKDVEAESIVNVTATADGGETVCIDSSAASVGYNATCGTGITSLLWTAHSESSVDNTGAYNISFNYTSDINGTLTLQGIRNNSAMRYPFTLKIYGTNTGETDTTMWVYHDADGEANGGSGVDLIDCYDEDYGTYGYATTTAYCYMNYTCGDCVGTRENTILQYKWYNGIMANTVNVTLEDDDCNIDNVQIRVTMIETVGGTDYFILDCIDDTIPSQYNTIHTVNTPDSFGLYRFYESSTYFNDTVGADNYSKDITFDYGADGSVEVGVAGEIRETQSVSTEFNGTESEFFSYQAVGGVQTTSIKATANAPIDSMSMSMEGNTNEYFKGIDSLNTLDEEGYYYRSYGSGVAAYNGYLWSFGHSHDQKPCDSTTGQKHNCTVRVEPLAGFGAWSNTNILTDVPYEAGHGSCAVHVGNGEIYVIGGQDEANVAQDDVYVYDADGDSWSAAKTVMPAAKFFHECVYDGNNIIWVFGGYLNGGTANRSIWSYSVSGNSWTNTYTASGDWSEMGGAEMLNTEEIIFFGGFRNGGYTSGGQTLVYNITDDSWTDYGNTDTGARSSVLAGKVGGKVFMFGGWDIDGDNTEEAWVWDNSDQTWYELSTNISNFYLQSYARCDELNDKIACFGSSGFGVGGMNAIIDMLPTDVNVQVGATNNVGFAVAGALYDEQTNSDLATMANDALSDCEIASDGFCYLTVYVANNGGGDINLTSIEFSQNYTDIEIVNTTVTCDSAWCNPTIEINSSKTGGLMNVYDLNYSWQGTGNVTFTARNGTTTDNHIATVYYSDITRVLPYTFTEVIFFLPKSGNESDVKASYQTSIIPIMNITGAAQDKSINLSVRLNETISCVTLQISEDNNVSNAVNVTEGASWTNLTQITITGSDWFWMWAQFNECNGSETRYYQPQLKWGACCDTCEACP